MAFGKSQKDPFSTAVGHLIERATVGALPAEEWGQFMHICDIINTTDEGPKDAVKALKKRISKNCNHKEIRFTLSLLDMCVKNCGPSFQSLVVKKDFCKDKLVKLLHPRYNLPADTQDTILAFIRTWAYGFQGTVDVSEVKEVYLELLKKGVQFPSSDANPGTHKRASSWPSEKPPPPSAVSVKSTPVPRPSAPTITLTSEQIGKLYSELDMAKMNAKVMSAILTENVPGSENLDDMELLQKLYKICRVMQERIVELLVAVENEDVIAELIQANEDLNNVLLGHESVFSSEDQSILQRWVMLIHPPEIPVRFSRNRVRFLENQRIQREQAEIYSKQPSAPSCDLLDVNSSSSIPVSALGGTGPETPQFSELNCRSTSAADPSIHHPLLYPQLDLLALANAQQPSFATGAQSTSQSIPEGHIYNNLATLLNPVPLQTVNLQTVNASSLNEITPGASPADVSKSSSQTPHYYEIMEFDPLAPSYSTEAIYEEIDDYISKSEVKKHTDC
ncbi:TOM1-like protein 1 isoform X2 [Trachemys scripta elegans]|uniref:TOM1-like protein 1 isoform X2 n=1 Tax=Trachemys scripta elegans TaxID=31138 RepID=UPI00155205EA|nr:TOM1-like protein 1 isoform X2 [Trachemys scripta elegans]